MPVQFKVNKESLDRVVLPEGLYTMEVMSFKPATSKKGDSTNINGRYQVIGPVGSDDPEVAAKKVQVFDSLNTGFGVGIQDFVHACGFELDDDGNMPGSFDGASEDKLAYSGPLLGVRFQAEIAVRDYNGPQNAIRSYVCAVPDCNVKNPKIRHSKNLLGKA